jgi:hypothetical protein
MEVGQIRLGIQLVMEENICIHERVQIHNQVKSGSLVLESRTMKKCAMKTIVSVSSIENENKCNIILN